MNGVNGAERLSPYIPVGVDRPVMAAAGGPRVMVVDDDPQIRSLYADFLAGFDVVTAAGGREALDRLDGSVDVLLVDRQMPGLSGDEVAEQVRARSVGCAIALVTGVDPDLDIVDAGIDGYAVKPVSRGELTTLVSRLYRWLEYDSRLREYYAIAEKVAVLEAEAGLGPPRRREAEYRRLRRRLEATKAEAREALDVVAADEEPLATLFRRPVAAD